MLKTEYHVIPVPNGWSPEVSWEAISRGELLTDPDPNWANVVVIGGRYQGLLDEENPRTREDDE